MAQTPVNPIAFYTELSSHLKTLERCRQLKHIILADIENAQTLSQFYTRVGGNSPHVAKNIKRVIQDGWTMILSVDERIELLEAAARKS